MRHTAGVGVLASNLAAAQAQRADRGPLETSTRAYRPWNPKESALLCRYHLVPWYGPCLVVCVLFLRSDMHVSLPTAS